jgi:RNA polymerase sigma-H factor
MAVRTAAAPKTPQKLQRELEDLQLVLRARNGSEGARDELMRRYHGFVRLKASSYFLAGGDAEDLIQEGMIGLFKAIRDFRSDKETSFRSFAELCVTRQIITAIKSATRYKHAPLNTYISFSHTPAGQESDGECTLGDALPGPSIDDPCASCRRRSSRRSWGVSGRACRVSSRRRFACTSTVTRTSRWLTSSPATARRSTTRSSA